MAVPFEKLRAHLWWVYLAAMLAAALASLGAGLHTRGAVSVALAVVGAAAIAAGLGLHRPARGAPWLLLLGSQLLWAAGWGYWWEHDNQIGVTPSSASHVNVVYLAGYPLVFIALLLLVRARERDRISVIDTAIVFFALFAIAFGTLIFTYLDTSGLDRIGLGGQVAYAALDVLVLAGAVRVLLSPGRRSPALWLLAAGSLAPVYSDAIWNWSTRIDENLPAWWANAGWYLFPALVGAAALHPSMRTLFDKAAPIARRFRWSRMLTLAAAALVAPAIILATPSDLFDIDRRLGLGSAAAVIGLLILARLALILRDDEVLVSELASTNQRLLELDALKDSFVASVSHELRTPLTSIRGYLELVLDPETGELNEEQQKFLEVVDRNAHRLLRVVGDLLFVAQVDAGKLDLELGPVEAVETAAEAIAAARPLAEQKGVDLVFNPGGAPVFQADRARLAQVLDNLVSNAIKFTDAGGRVELDVSSSGDDVVFEVSDTGMGIPAAEQQRLFERFFRTEAAGARAIQGTGLGLAIAKAIVDAHGGSISVHSEEGRGTTFRVELPLVAVRDARAPEEVYA